MEVRMSIKASEPDDQLHSFSYSGEGVEIKTEADTGSAETIVAERENTGKNSEELDSATTYFGEVEEDTELPRDFEIDVNGEQINPEVMAVLERQPDIKKKNLCEVKPGLICSRSLNAKLKKYVCKYCSKTCSNNKRLKLHYKIHDVERPFKCKICNKTFTQAGNLRIHVLIHTGEKRFQCTLCSKAFTQSGGLRNHLLTHSGEKPFKCQICDKSFTQKGGLQFHLFTHTREFRYQCHLCYKGFFYKYELLQHLQFQSEKM